MKQLLQNLGDGKTEVVEIPCPRIQPGHLLIQTARSLISTGTERMLVEFGRGSLLAKARQQPDKVRQVLEKIVTDGLFPTIEAVRGKLNQPIPLGYCNVGVVIGVGSGVQGFQVGDRVISNGPHAEVVNVPVNLCAHIPKNVDDRTAVFTVVGAIGLQGIRLARPTLGEAFAVTGLGLIGLLTVQLLKAHGCRVLGIDLLEERLELARAFGADTLLLKAGEHPVDAALSFSRGRGMDGVIITASTKSNDPVHHAARMCRKRGRIILVGVTGLALSRADFYEKELSFQVSCSYGPGRYDPDYELKGQDYPAGFVRWTEQRNFEAVLDMMATGQLQCSSLISERYEIHSAAEAYDRLTGDRPPLSLMLTYPEPDTATTSRVTRRSFPIEGAQEKIKTTGGPVLGVIGAGNYASRILLPAVVRTGARVKTIAGNQGISGTLFGRKFGFEQTTTDTEVLFEDEEIDTVLIVTRHDTHAGFVCRALETGKKIFVEKPLAITRAQLAGIESAYEAASKSSSPMVMIGFNRRFAPQIVKMKQLLGSVSQPKTMIMTVNAGFIPSDHWIQDPAIGGGRILGEGCHFVDLLRFLVGSPITGVHATQIGNTGAVSTPGDKVTLTLTFEDGSMGAVHYFGNGHRSFPKERLEVFCAERVLQLDNFRRLRGFGWPGFRKLNLRRQDKGQAACMAAFIQAAEQGRSAPIPFPELIEVAEACFRVVEQLGPGNEVGGT